MDSAETQKRPWLHRLWRGWQEVDAMRGLAETVGGAMAFVSKWWQTAVALVGIFGGVAIALVGAAFTYWAFLPAAAMFGIGVALAIRLLRRQTVDLYSSEITTTNYDRTPEHDEAPVNGEAGNPEGKPVHGSHKYPNGPEHYHPRFDCLWGMHLVRQVYLFESLNNILNAPSRWRISGPYCRTDKTRLKLTDGYGVRDVLDEDDIGGRGGRLYCPTCDEAFRPDEGYMGERKVETYRKQVEKEVNG